jgi:hypothetical protein
MKRKKKRLTTRQRINKLNKELEPFFDGLRKSGANFAHLTCGWQGKELTPDGKCPKCGEPFPEP